MIRIEKRTSGFSAQDKKTGTVWCPWGATPGQRHLSRANAGTRADLPSEPVFVFHLPRRRLRGCLEPQLFFIALRLKKALSIFLERRGGKEIFSFLAQEEGLLQFRICLPCWVELAGKSPKGTPPGEDWPAEPMSSWVGCAFGHHAYSPQRADAHTCAEEARDPCAGL